MNRVEGLLLTVVGGVMMTLGVLASGALSPSPVHAGTADSGAGVVAVTGLSSSNQDVLYLFDTQSRRLAVYKVDASDRLELLAVRDTTYDLKPEAFGKQEPSVNDLKDAWKEHEEQASEGRGRRR